jgi:predicted pyridoxine 5'-phosphate oxidase superfamily flavin-nucleotide-binding protein
MGKVFDAIEPKLAEWIGRQRLFFVATAPDGAGHVNLSPKGPIESLRVLDPHTVAYLDFVGSGIETVAHLRQNGRICLMLCAFQGPPRVLRLHGQGEVLRPGSAEFTRVEAGFDLAALPAARDAARSLVKVAVERIADSCGYDVPLMEYRGVRPQRMAWVESKLAKGGDGAIAEYVTSRNAESIDGLPGI